MTAEKRLKRQLNEIKKKTRTQPSIALVRRLASGFSLFLLVFLSVIPTLVVILSRANNLFICHSLEKGNPDVGTTWIPAFAGMTIERDSSFHSE